MGMSLTTLHVYGAEKEELKKKLAPGDLLREQNAPWLGVTPEEGAEIEDAERFGKLAARLTKSSAAAALVFFWFDDERFLCRFYRDGRRRAECRSGESWAKLGKQLNALYGDEAAGKALRYASRCYDLEEELRLLEETVGAALYDHPLEEPRRVPRGDATLRAVKQREALLRKRPNQYVLTELEQPDWPEELQIRETLLKLLRPEWRKYHLSSLLYGNSTIPHMVPGSSDLAAYAYIDFPHHRDGLLFYNSRTGEYWEPDKLPGMPAWAVWQTRQGETVLLFHQITTERQEGSSWSRLGGGGFVSALSPDGAERWRFAPEVKDGSLSYVHTSPEGVVTVFLSGNANTRQDTLIWQIDGETGELLRSRRISSAEQVYALVYVEALDAFLCARRERKELVVLNAALEEIACWGDYEGDVYFRAEMICGPLAWDQRWWDKRSVWFYDLRDGSTRKIPLELPVYVSHVLDDGRILGVTQQENSFTVFDREGKVCARCRLPGVLNRFHLQDGRVCLLELRGPDFGALVCDELFDRTETHVWRLDPAGKD